MASLKDKIAALEAQVAAAKIGETEREEIEQRAKIAKLEAEREEALRERMGLEAERRRDIVADNTPGKRLDVLVIPERMCIFVLDDPGSRAYNEWSQGILSVGSKDRNKRGADPTSVNRAYAVEAVADFTLVRMDDSGALSFESITREELKSAGNTSGAKLVHFLREYPAVASQIVNQATTLAGLAKEERKSGD